MSLKNGQKFVITITSIFTTAAIAFLAYSHLNIKQPVLDWIPCDTNIYTQQYNKTQKNMPNSCKAIVSVYTESDYPEYDPTVEDIYIIDGEVKLDYLSTRKIFVAEGTEAFAAGIPLVCTSAKNLLKYNTIMLDLMNISDEDNERYQVTFKNQYYYGLGFRLTGEGYSLDFDGGSIPFCAYDYICDFNGWPKSGKLICYNYAHSDIDREYYMNTICEYTIQFEGQ